MKAITVHIVEYLAPGGIETLVLDLLRSSSGHDRVFSLGGRREDLIAGWPALGPYAHRIDCFGRVPGISPWMVWRLARRLVELRPGAVVLHHIGPLLYGGLAAALARVPRLVYVEHDAWHYRRPRHRPLMAMLSRLLSPRHIAVSTQIATEMRKIVPSARVSVIPPGVDLCRFKPGERNAARRRIGLAEGRRVVGTVGRLAPEKNHKLLIHALGGLADDVNLVIVGDGPERQNLEAEAQVGGAGARVHFLGHCDDVEEIYPAFDVFALPSRFEGLPRCVLEAQACDVPVIATDVGALAEAVCPKSGLLVPPDDERALVAGLQALLARLDRSGSPRAHVQARLSFAQTADCFRRVIEEA